MDFDESKRKLIEFYTKYDYKLIDEHSNEIYFKFREWAFKVGENEINSYMNTMKNNFQNKPNDWSICNQEYRESLVKFLNRFDRIKFIKEKKYLFGKEDADNIYVEIGVCSNSYFNYYRLNDDYYSYYSARFPKFRKFEILKEKCVNGFNELEDLYRNPTTIKVFNLKTHDINKAISVSNKIVNSCLFELSYLKDITIMLEDNTSFFKSVRDKFDYHTEKDKNKRLMPFPRVFFNSDIIKFYQLGMSSDISTLKFLAFYQVLEYFFLKVAEEKLFNSLAYHIKDPHFDTSSTSIERLIKSFNEHSKINTNEKDMLTNVLKKYVEFNDLEDFLRKYEEFLDEKIYTEKNIIFGKDIFVTIDTKHIYGNIAKLINVIRNALVHSSDKYDREKRHIPYSESEETVKKHIPLLKFLAEKVIISTGKNYIK